LITTIHTNTAPQIVTRLINDGVPAFQIGSCVTLLVAQRLLQTNCEHCAERVYYDEDTLEEAGFAPFEYGEVNARESKGCQLCNNHGVSGRIAIQETLDCTDSIKKIIRSGKDNLEEALWREGVRNGMRPLRRVALDLVKRGVVSLSEVLANTEPIPSEVREDVYALVSPSALLDEAEFDPNVTGEYAYREPTKVRTGDYTGEFESQPPIELGPSSRPQLAGAEGEEVSADPPALPPYVTPLDEPPPVDAILEDEPDYEAGVEPEPPAPEPGGLVAAELAVRDETHSEAAALVLDAAPDRPAVPEARGEFVLDVTPEPDEAEHGGNGFDGAAAYAAEIDPFGATAREPFAVAIEPAAPEPVGEPTDGWHGLIAEANWQSPDVEPEPEPIAARRDAGIEAEEVGARPLAAAAEATPAPVPEPRPGARGSEFDMLDDLIQNARRIAEQTAGVSRSPEGPRPGLPRPPAEPRSRKLPI